MTNLNAQLDTASVGDKIVRTADGAYISLQATAGGAPSLLDATDDAWLLPAGTHIKVTGTSPVLFTVDVKYPPNNDQTSGSATIITTTAVTTPIQTFLAGLDTFDDLLSTPRV